MNAMAIAESANKLFSKAPFLVHIHNEEEYASALEMVELLLDEDADANQFLIERLADVIEEWENSAPEFATFNASVAALDGVDMLKYLMEQHGLGVADLPEVGGKSYVSKILNRQGRGLTRKHIQALSERFSVSPAFFFATSHTP
ncbi:helix-turn-helix domain-containing protein [Halomonas llamarensis]|uniref:Transcriptional regulator n=1 Tax=Halomonas llamarensis TaxID=2945104 RepID=A0ABT0SPT5_9GAMM|nr:hypothetical protein [Halomonas llamarensis]MCL7929578.1 hypothetical protein [Halomonas llamarensis]